MHTLVAYFDSCMFLLTICSISNKKVFKIYFYTVGIMYGKQVSLYNNIIFCWKLHIASTAIILQLYDVMSCYTMLC